MSKSRSDAPASTSGGKRKYDGLDEGQEYNPCGAVMGQATNRIVEGDGSAYSALMNTFEYGEDLDKAGIVIAINPPSGTKEMEFDVVDFGWVAEFKFMWPDVMCNISSLLDDKFTSREIARDDPIVLALKQALKKQRQEFDLPANRRPHLNVRFVLPFQVGCYRRQYEVHHITTNTGRNDSAVQSVIVKLFALKQDLEDADEVKKIT